MIWGEGAGVCDPCPLPPQTVARGAEMEEKRQRLLKLLREKSFRYSPEKPFRLASGRESPYYVDARPVTFSAPGLALIGEIFYELLKDLKVQAVGGLTLGADPLAHAVALTSFLKGNPINSFTVRKEAKEHGAGRRVEGDVRPGERVVIVEDVLTTGASILKAVAGAREFGLEVVKVLVLVDREEGGREAVAAVVPRFEAVFTLSRLKGSG
jgi:orotate phosphoribosyltransferase